MIDQKKKFEQNSCFRILMRVRSYIWVWLCFWSKCDHHKKLKNNFFFFLLLLLPSNTTECWRRVRNITRQIDKNTIDLRIRVSKCARVKNVFWMFDDYLCARTHTHTQTFFELSKNTLIGQKGLIINFPVRNSITQWQAIFILASVCLQLNECHALKLTN